VSDLALYQGRSETRPHHAASAALSDIAFTIPGWTFAYRIDVCCQRLGIDNGFDQLLDVTGLLM
jgi:hypothetical protein